MSPRGLALAPRSASRALALISEGDRQEQPMLRVRKRPHVDFERVGELERPREEEAGGDHGPEPLVGLLRLDADDLAAGQAVQRFAAGRDGGLTQGGLAQSIDGSCDAGAREEVAGERAFQEKETVS